MTLIFHLQTFVFNLDGSQFTDEHALTSENNHHQAGNCYNVRVGVSLLLCLLIKWSFKSQKLRQCLSPRTARHMMYNAFDTLNTWAARV